MPAATAQPGVKAAIRHANDQYAVSRQSLRGCTEKRAGIGQLLEAVPDGDGIHLVTVGQFLEHCGNHAIALCSCELIRLLVDIDPGEVPAALAGNAEERTNVAAYLNASAGATQDAMQSLLA